MIEKSLKLIRLRPGMFSVWKECSGANVRVMVTQSCINHNRQPNKEEEQRTNNVTVTHSEQESHVLRLEMSVQLEQRLLKSLHVERRVELRMQRRVQCALRLRRRALLQREVLVQQVTLGSLEGSYEVMASTVAFNRLLHH